MKKIIKLENLDCASCASKMEDVIKKIKGVEDVSVNFMTQKMELKIKGANYDVIMLKIKELCKKVAPDCTILDK